MRTWARAMPVEGRYSAAAEATACKYYLGLLNPAAHYGR